METRLPSLVLTGPPGLFEIVFALFAFSILIAIVPFVFYLITLQNTLELVSPENRRMSPANVWLSYVPIFGIAWQFVIVSSLTSSLKAEFASRGIEPAGQNFGNGIGIAYSILFCLNLIPFVGEFTFLAALICWIIYWVRISNLKLQLSEIKS